MGKAVALNGRCVPLVAVNPEAAIVVETAVLLLGRRGKRYQGGMSCSSQFAGLISGLDRRC